MSIVGNMAGCYSPMGKTFILTDENGNEVTGVVVDQEEVFTATTADVRIGKKYASNEGVKEGENTITYRTRRGYKAIPSGDNFSIPLPEHDLYNYTELHCIIAPFNTAPSDSVSADKVVLYDGVYATGSIEKMADVTKNDTEKTIDLNITNNSERLYMVHYFTYKQED